MAVEESTLLEVKDVKKIVSNKSFAVLSAVILDVKK